MDMIEQFPKLQTSNAAASSPGQLVNSVAALVKSSAGHYGQAFFDSLIQCLADTTGIDFVYLAKVDAEQMYSQTISLRIDGEPGENFGYDLEGTPCKEVAVRNSCLFPKKVTELFPEDQLLIDLGVEGYMGTPLHGSKGEVLGLVVFMSRTPLVDTQNLMTLLTLAASLLTAELSRSAIEEENLRLSNIESVTGLPNKAALRRYLEDVGRKTMMFLQVDELPAINDAYGFNVGDAVMRSVSERIQQVVSAEFYACLGPSKLAVVMDDDVDPGEIVEAVRDHFMRTPVTTGRVSIYVSMMCGAATGDKDLLKNAAAALRQARTLGSFQHLAPSVGETEEIKRQQVAYINTSNLVHEAIKRHRILPVFQRIIDTETGAIRLMEARMRIFHNNQMIAPKEFLEAAIAAGTVTALTRAMFSKTAQIMASHQIPFMHRISSYDLSEGYLFDYLQSELAKVNVSNSNVTLSVSQSMLSDNATRFTDQLQALKSAGFGLAIDKFGTGQLNFNSMMDIDFDFIKIDGQLVSGAVTEPRCRTLVTTAVQLCQNLGAVAIAEHVETEQVHQFMRALGVDCCQGNWFGKPEVLSI